MSDGWACPSIASAPRGPGRRRGLRRWGRPEARRVGKLGSPCAMVRAGAPAVTTRNVAMAATAMTTNAANPVTAVRRRRRIRPALRMATSAMLFSDVGGLVPALAANASRSASSIMVTSPVLLPPTRRSPPGRPPVRASRTRLRVRAAPSVRLPLPVRPSPAPVAGTAGRSRTVGGRAGRAAGSMPSALSRSRSVASARDAWLFTVPTDTPSRRAVSASTGPRRSAGPARPAAGAAAPGRGATARRARALLDPVGGRRLRQDLRGPLPCQRRRHQLVAVLTSTRRAYGSTASMWPSRFHAR